MSRPPENSNLVVSIDIGTLYIKAFLQFKNDEAVRSVQWAHSGQPSQQDCIPAMLAYDKGSGPDAAPLYFGFNAFDNKDNEGLDVYEFFKPIFGQAALEEANGTEPSSSRAAAQRAALRNVKPYKDPHGPGKDVVVLYKDLLKNIYASVELTYSRLASRYPSILPWNSTTVSFVLSVPAAGNAQVVGNFLLEAARQTGFERRSGNPPVVLHEVWGFMTEPAAGSVYAISKAGVLADAANFLMVDIGGGTSDLQFVQAVHTGSVNIDALEPVSGRHIGSVHINEDFFQLLQAYLHMVHQETGVSVLHPATKARVLSRSPPFEHIKNAVGQMDSALSDDREWMLDLDRRLPDTTLASVPGLRIEAGKLVIHSSVVENLWRKQIVGADGDGEVLHPGVIGQICTVLEDMMVKGVSRDAYGNRPETVLQLGWIVLSGGMGGTTWCSSALEDCVNQLGRKREGAYPNLQNVKFLTVDEPQTCVARGMLIAARATLSSKASVAVATEPKKKGKQYVLKYFRKNKG